MIILIEYSSSYTRLEDDFFDVVLLFNLINLALNVEDAKEHNNFIVLFDR